jgi:hypothetical protein
MTSGNNNYENVALPLTNLSTDKALWSIYGLKRTTQSSLWDMGTPGSPPTRLTAVPDKWARPTRRLADLSVGPADLAGSPRDLLKTFQKIPQTTWSATTSRLGVQDKTSVDFDQSISTEYGKSCNQLDLGFPIVTDLDSSPPTLSVAQYKAGKGVLPGTTNNQQANTCNPQTTSTWDRSNTNRRTGRRVFLSGGPNQYKIALSLCLVVISMCHTSITIAFLAPDLPAEQLNHWE